MSELTIQILIAIHYVVIKTNGYINKIVISIFNTNFTNFTIK